MSGLSASRAQLHLTCSSMKVCLCSLYNNIKQPSALAHGADFHLFKKGIEPKWEDPRCAAGGKWTVQIKKGQAGTLDQYWLHIVSPILIQNTLRKGWSWALYSGRLRT